MACRLRGRPGAGPGTRHGSSRGVDRRAAGPQRLSTDASLSCATDRAAAGQASPAPAMRAGHDAAGDRVGPRPGHQDALAALLVPEESRPARMCRKVSTDLARRFDLIRVEDLQIGNMTRLRERRQGSDASLNVRAKAGLSRGIMRSGRSTVSVRASGGHDLGPVEKVRSAFTSQGAGGVGRWTGTRVKSQAVFRCTPGSACDADVNAAATAIAEVSASSRDHAPGRRRGARPVNREPHLLLPIGVVV